MLCTTCILSTDLQAEQIPDTEAYSYMWHVKWLSPGLTISLDDEYSLQLTSQKTHCSLACDRVANMHLDTLSWGVLLLPHNT